MGVLDDELAHADEAAVTDRPVPRSAKPSCSASRLDASFDDQVAGSGRRAPDHHIPLEFAIEGGHALCHAWKQGPVGSVQPPFPVTRGKAESAVAVPDCCRLEPEGRSVERELQPVDSELGAVEAIGGD